MTESQTPDTDRTHTPLPFESRLVMNQMDNQGSTICAFGGYQGSPRWMMFSPHMPGDTEADAKFIARACNSHYKLVDALTGLLPFHVSTEAQLPSEREAYRIAWKTAHTAIADATKPEQEKPHDASNN